MVGSIVMPFNLTASLNLIDLNISLILFTLPEETNLNLCYIDVSVLGMDPRIICTFQTAMS